jgi:outer membrane protein OmpA-like peptidoglycan-associated protein
MVVIKRDRIEIKKQINFASGSARILGATSKAVLNDVAQALKDAPFIKKVRIEGHTDSNGTDAANLRLSQTRAEAVMAELLRRGIDPGRMEAVGFGETKPISSNATARGRAENRRTEFNIVEQ